MHCECTLGYQRSLSSASFRYHCALLLPILGVFSFHLRVSVRCHLSLLLLFSFAAISVCSDVPSGFFFLLPFRHFRLPPPPSSTFPPFLFGLLSVGSACYCFPAVLFSLLILYAPSSPNPPFSAKRIFSFALSVCVHIFFLSLADELRAPFVPDVHSYTLLSFFQPPFRWSLCGLCLEGSRRRGQGRDSAQRYVHTRIRVITASSKERPGHHDGKW